MSTDPIVAEIHRQRAEEMERYGFDFAAFCRDLREQEKHTSPPPLSPPAARPNLATPRARRAPR